VAGPDRDAELPLELLRQAGELRAAAGEDDLADGVALRLRLVIGQGRDELADERLDAAMQRLDGRDGLFGRKSLGSGPSVEREVALDGLDLRLVHTEDAGETGRELRAAPLEYARELADAAVRDRQGRAVVPDRDGDDCRLLAIARRRERPQKSERLEIDPGERQSREAAGLDVALDEVAMRNDEQDAPQALAALALPLAEHAVVEHR